jgi:hypothetical protein
MRWYRTKRPMQLRSFMFSIWILIIPHSSTTDLWLQKWHLVAKRGETSWVMPVKFSYISLIPIGFFKMAKSLMACGRRLYFPCEQSRVTKFLSPLKIHRSRPDLNPRVQHRKLQNGTLPRCIASVKDTASLNYHELQKSCDKAWYLVTKCFSVFAFS